MGLVFGKLTRDSRLPWLVLAVALYRMHKPGQQTLLEQAAKALNNGQFSKMISDMLGMYLLVWVVRKAIAAKRAFRSTTLKTLKDDIGSKIMTTLESLPGASNKIKSEFNKIEADLMKSLKDDNREQITVLPTKGTPHVEIVAKMEALYAKEKSLWHDGWVSGAVYHGGDEHIKLQNEAFCLFAISNPLHPDMWPSVMQFEADIISMTANLLNGGNKEVCGTMTSGGTESILMAAKTHRQWAEKELGITRPEIVAPQTAHAGIDKACDILGIKLVHVPIDMVTFKVNPKKLAKYITSDTIMIYCSAPQYPHGIIDPIEELSKLAVSFGIGLHVDCCLGGFVLPFARKLGYDVPLFNFELPGVTSISVDTHKYGYAAKGTSVVLYKNREMRRHQYFSFPNWPGGLYVTPSTAGSRPGALSAACWSSLVAMGEEGFLNATKKIIETQRKIKASVQNIDGIELCGDPIAMIVAFQSKHFNIYNLSEKMHDKGWTLNALQNPPSVHICITLRTVEGNAADRFISDLTECSKECLDNPGDMEKGAAIYGLASAMPAGPVSRMLNTYTDCVLAP